MSKRKHGRATLPLTFPITSPLATSFRIAIPTPSPPVQLSNHFFTSMKRPMLLNPKRTWWSGPIHHRCFSLRICNADYNSTTPPLMTTVTIQVILQVLCFNRTIRHSTNISHESHNDETAAIASMLIQISSRKKDCMGKRPSSPNRIPWPPL
ncbi:uncharacterized protein EI90DRAFT_3074776 [Cantharellus anzutake]|uniref:uncharacterized protein n=1 Tax=Cantharellus anzutake TaxID=1750568 RepID=UPI0019078394|nr:uncharacterized protein EI90DRAFT_3074776 [Cantharellus anzutake]KAF8324686.1 hypothetical protein EI90DRAFT_3074776 [Cantharellus anzutake]